VPDPAIEGSPAATTDDPLAPLDPEEPASSGPAV
jgi:hypothetical protein